MRASSLHQLRLLAVAAVAYSAAACSASVSTDSGEASEEVGVTRGLVRIERSTTLEPDGARAYALARFANVSSANADRVLELLQLTNPLPDVGQCYEADAESQPALSGLGRVELLEAGDVTIAAADQATLLAPRAFPTVKDLVSGVVYSTRDQATDPLPAAASYRITSSGSALLAPLDITAEAPLSPTDVLLDGLNLGEVGSLDLNRPVRIAWEPGDDLDPEYRDLMVFELSDGVSTVLCGFDDLTGQGTVPQAVLQNSTLALQDGRGGEASVALHRVRSVGFTSEGIDEGEIRFDFEVRSRLRVLRTGAE
ncbi:MAG: hypothetical protein KC766_09585 [Myxococcales bacterium]|nr:hypothetical protein [Myxococcales bacterium]